MDAAEQRQARADLLELLAMLVGPLPRTPAPAVLLDRAPDPGLFGPESVTWRLAREPLLLLGGGRALLMQVAHPLVGQGVADHSDYALRPFGRLLGTVHWLVRVIFGTRAEAAAASRRVAGVHARVHGSLAPANATPRFSPKSHYSATDPALALWVHATIVESLLVAHDALIGSLPETERDRLVQEWAPAGELMGIAPCSLWRTAAQLHAYTACQINAGVVAPVPASREIAATVLRPPLPWPGLGLAAALMGFVTVGLLPERLRSGFGLRWTRVDEGAFGALCVTARILHPWLPRRLRVTPLSDSAIRRVNAHGGPIQNR